MEAKSKYCDGIPVNLGGEHHDARIIAIEYRDGWPHAVVTAYTHVNRYSGASYRGGSTYDFDYCGPKHGLYHHECGSGGRKYHIGRFCNPRGLPGKLWLADGVELVDFSGNPVTCEQARKWGYDLLAEPLLVDGDVDPFAHASEGRTVDCSVCGERMPEDDTCEHLWCPDCGCGEMYGCGSTEHAADDHKEGLFALFDSMPLADVLSLREKIGSHDYQCDWPTRDIINVLWRRWRWEDGGDGEPGDCGIGAAWLASLDCGRTYDADVQTVAMIDEWVGVSGLVELQI